MSKCTKKKIILFPTGFQHFIFLNLSHMEFMVGKFRKYFLLLFIERKNVTLARMS